MGENGSVEELLVQGHAKVVGNGTEVVVGDGLPDDAAAHEKALNLALNKISGQWDNEKLSAVLQDLSAGFDVEVTGFDQHEVDALVASFAESGHEYELPGSEPYINNFFDSGVQAKPKAEEPAAAPAPEAPAQDAEMHPNAAPAPNEVQAVQPGGKKTVIVPNLSEQDASTLVDVLKDMGFAYRLEDAA